MFYITASCGDRYMEVGRQEGLYTALNYADNMGTMFSEGVRPQTVRVRVQNIDESISITQEFYNGYVKVVESKGV